MKNLYLLPTDKDSNLFIGDLSNQLHFNYSIEKGNSINQHIYITNSQEIKKGNWYLEEKSKFNPRKLISEEWGDGQHFKTFNQKGFRKIILTTDQDLIKDGVQAIDDEFLEWFVKNPSCEEVNIDSKLIVTQTKPLIQHQGSKPIVVPHKIKYKIIIPKKEPCTCKKHDPYCCHIHGSCPTCVKKEEPKQETLEEAAKTYAKIPLHRDVDSEERYFNSDVREYDAFKDGAQWQQEQDKKLYSEEEVKELIVDAINSCTDGVSSHCQDFEEWWFEQFKKTQ